MKVYFFIRCLITIATGFIRFRYYRILRIIANLTVAPLINCETIACIDNCCHWKIGSRYGPGTTYGSRYECITRFQGVWHKVTLFKIFDTNVHIVVAFKITSSLKGGYFTVHITVEFQIKSRLNVHITVAFQNIIGLNEYYLDLKMQATTIVPTIKKTPWRNHSNNMYEPYKIDHH